MACSGWISEDNNPLALVSRNITISGFFISTFIVASHLKYYDAVSVVCWTEFLTTFKFHANRSIGTLIRICPELPCKHGTWAKHDSLVLPIYWRSWGIYCVQQQIQATGCALDTHYNISPIIESSSLPSSLKKQVWAFERGRRLCVTRHQTQQQPAWPPFQGPTPLLIWFQSALLTSTLFSTAFTHTAKNYQTILINDH